MKHLELCTCAVCSCEEHTEMSNLRQQQLHVSGKLFFKSLFKHVQPRETVRENVTMNDNSPDYQIMSQISTKN